MDKKEFKNSVYTEISRVAKAFSNPNRLEIVDLISNGAKSVEDIALETRITIANTSQHLQALKKERLVKTSKKGHHVYYSLASKEVYRTWKCLRDLTISLSPHVGSLVNNFRSLFGVEKSYSFEDVQNRKDIVLLDVRPNDEYRQAHIPEAISIPIDDLEKNLTKIPKDKLIITYCRGMFCHYAEEAVRILHNNGYSAIRLEENVIDYKSLNEENAGKC